MAQRHTRKEVGLENALPERWGLKVHLKWGNGSKAHSKVIEGSKTHSKRGRVKKCTT
jgi:hypothetical protein